MQAYHGSSQLKSEYLSRVMAHQAADEIVKGRYWEGGKGCAVGCTVHSSEHAAYETELGIPRVIARLEDGIFEGLSNEEAKLFPTQFLEAVPVGADLSGVFCRFMHWLLVDEIDGVIKFARSEKSKKAISRVAELFLKQIRGQAVEIEEWRAADAATRATRAADAAATCAADAAYAATCAAEAADAAACAAACDAARQATRSRQKDKLLELLRAAPVVIREEK